MLPVLWVSVALFCRGVGGNPLLPITLKQSPFSIRQVPTGVPPQLLDKKGFGADGHLHNLLGIWFSKSQNVRGGRNLRDLLVQPLYLTNLETEAQSS